MRCLAGPKHIQHWPVTIYYAFKQSEKKGRFQAFISTGWETFLDAA